MRTLIIHSVVLLMLISISYSKDKMTGYYAVLVGIADYPRYYI